MWGIVLLSAAGLTVSGAAWTNWLQMLMGVALGAASLIVLALRKPL